MSPTGTFLLSIGLCLDWVTRAKMASLSRPTLWALPSPMIYNGADVTLRCQGDLGCDRLQLWKDGELREERNASWELAEFVLRNVDDLKDARTYSCRCGRGSSWSEFSDPLALVVMTGLPAPSIVASPGPTVSAGTTVTIRCQVSGQATPQDYNFALLEAKSREPLGIQHSSGTWAVFSLQSVRAEDTGSYSCIYFRKTAPHRGSSPNKSLELTVTGPLPKPTLWAQSGLMITPGFNITLWCSKPKLSTLGEVTFTLRKAGRQVPGQHRTSTLLWTSFLLPSVRPEDTGSYSCAYRERRSSGAESEPSDALELVVPGSLPRPSLSALPGLMVMPGTHVSLQCRLPPQSSLQRVTLSLLKGGTPQSLQSQSPVGSYADFPLLSVGAQDAGTYSCVYYGRMEPHQVSEASEALEIWVTGAGPKPSLSVWPGPEVASGADVTLLCRGPSWRRSFVLYKDRDEKILQSMDTTEEGARFLLAQVTPKDSGNYSCSHQVKTNGTLWKQHSDPLQLIVQGSKSTLINTLSCVSLLLFLLCLLLLALLSKRSITSGSFQGDRRTRSIFSFSLDPRCLCCPCLPLNTCLSHYPGNPRDEVLSTEETKGRSRPPLIPMNEEPGGVTYAQLNRNLLNERKIDPTKPSLDPIVYATVSKD